MIDGTWKVEAAASGCWLPLEAADRGAGSTMAANDNVNGSGGDVASSLSTPFFAISGKLAVTEYEASNSFDVVEPRLRGLPVAHACEGFGAWRGLRAEPTEQALWKDRADDGRGELSSNP